MTFPQLCNCPNIGQCKVLDMGFWFKNLWHWDIGFEQRNLDEEEEIQLENLLEILKKKTACIFCNGLKESTLHVFVECDFVLQVQDMVAVWFGAKDFVGAHLVTARLQYVRVQLHGFVNKKLFFVYFDQ